jgi:hypothetical protein
MGCSIFPSCCLFLSLFVIFVLTTDSSLQLAQAGISQPVCILTFGLNHRDLILFLYVHFTGSYPPLHFGLATASTSTPLIQSAISTLSSIATVIHRI